MTLVSCNLPHAMLLSALAMLILAPNSVRAAAAFAPRSGAKSPYSSPSALSMATSGNIFAKPIGIGSAAPKTVITNADLEHVVDTSDEWIFTRTGIAERHVLTDGENLRDLSILASKRALEMAGLEPTDIDLVICASSTPDDLFGDAPTIANELGCTSDTVAFDLVAACSGFLFGCVTAGKYLATPSSNIKRALVIGADSLSRWVDWDDRNTCILFGDGAGAMILEASPDEIGLLGMSSHSNGGGYCHLNVG